MTFVDSIANAARRVVSLERSYVRQRPEPLNNFPADDTPAPEPIPYRQLVPTIKDRETTVGHAFTVVIDHGVGAGGVRLPVHDLRRQTPSHDRDERPNPERAMSTLFGEERPTARKSHYCDSCDHVIAVGESYHATTSKGDYGIERFKQCTQHGDSPPVPRQVGRVGSDSTRSCAMTAPAETMRTKRRYAHELYPHPAEGEVQPLAEAVPYLYARAAGFDVHGTSWMDLLDNPATRTEPAERTNYMIACRERALIADALLQGLAGDEAWEWAEERNNPEGGEWIWERGNHYGVPVNSIKPYPCGPEPDTHDHYSDAEARNGWVTRIVGKESECADCCEPVPSTHDPKEK